MRKLTERARQLRKNMTDAERRLWSKLRGKQLGFKFKRQVPIGNYIVDFICPSKKLIIEVDGSQHINNEYDRKRDEYLKSRGYTVLRFWDNEVLKESEAVLQRIWYELNKDN